jgi:superfamily II DNA or RNA helicase
LIFSRANGRCQCEDACGLHADRCPTTITYETFHRSHLRARAHGGIDHASNEEAWCARCNLTLQARDARDPRISARDWQVRELDKIVGAIARTGAATLSAAPGAGKTLFAAFVFEALRAAGVIERMLVVVPKVNIAQQWVDALRVGRHLELKAHSATERPGQHGVVVTYQSLPNREQLETHMTMARRTPTLLVLDEVHHLARDIQGRHQAWANAIAELAGDVEVGDLRVAGILNLSGTLWRSAATERISTVRYTRPNATGRIQSIVDGEVTTEELIRAKQLRSLDLYRVNAKVRVADYAELSYVEGDLSDIDEQASRAVVSALGDIDSWRVAFVASVLDKLKKAHQAMQGHYVKALIVASTQDQATKFRDEVDRQMRAQGLQSLAILAKSDDGDEAQEALKLFRQQQRIGVLCTVDMAGEGYDCPEIAVLGYASNKLTSLYVRQVVARAMRVTDQERELGAVLPAIIILPDSEVLVQQVLAYLKPYTHEVLAEAESVIRGRPGGPDDPDRHRSPLLHRFHLDAAQPGEETVTVSFLDGTHETIHEELARNMKANLINANVPEIYWAKTIAFTQQQITQLRERRPFDIPMAVSPPSAPPCSPPPSPPTPSVESRETFFMADVEAEQIEQQAHLLQRKLHRLAGWVAANYGAEAAARFNTEVNKGARIPFNGRSSASLDQLRRALEIAELKVRVMGAERPQA